MEVNLLPASALTSAPQLVWLALFHLLVSNAQGALWKFMPFYRACPILWKTVAGRGRKFQFDFNTKKNEKWNHFVYALWGVITSLLFMNNENIGLLVFHLFFFLSRRVAAENIIFSLMKGQMIHRRNDLWLSSSTHFLYICVYMYTHMYTYLHVYVCTLIHVHHSMYICIQMCVYRGTISTDIYRNLLVFK